MVEILSAILVGGAIMWHTEKGGIFNVIFVNQVGFLRSPLKWVILLVPYW
jgi:hypothetical protein